MFFKPWIKVDTKEFERRLHGFEKQIPFAISKALNSTARDAVTVLQARLPEVFTIRTDWERRGLTFNPSGKSDLRAEVGSRHEYMEAQAKGGSKKPHEGKLVGIPLVGRGLPRPTEKSVTRPSRWPGAMVEKGRSFVGRPFGGENEAVWQRVAKGRGKDRRAGLRLLYILKPEVGIKARWPMKDTVDEIVRERWADHAISAIQEAIDTAK